MRESSYILKCVIMGLLTAVALVAMIPASASAESPDDILVFVHPSNSVRALEKAELRQLFLKQKTTWSSGESVVCINAPENTAARKQFRQLVLEMSETEEETHWSNARIRNQLSPPAEMASTAKAVFRLKNAVSYAFRKDVPAGVVKVVLTIPAK